MADTEDLKFTGISITQCDRIVYTIASDPMIACSIRKSLQKSLQFDLTLFNCPAKLCC